MHPDQNRPFPEDTEKNRTIVVTGASSGFGFEIAKRFLLEGYKVIALARRINRLEKLTTYSPSRVLIRALDVSDAEAVGRFFAAIPEKFTTIHGLVNNAGLSKGFGPIETADHQNLTTMVDTNVKGMISCTKHCLPYLLQRPGSHIINIGSIAAYYPYMGGNVYAATKAFVSNFSLNLLADLQGKNVRVTCIAPGMAKTEFALVRFGGDEARAESLYEGIDPLTPEDVAEAVYWCYSLPHRVNINVVELMPTNQPFSLGFPKK